MADDLRDLAWSELVEWPSVKVGRNPPIRRLAYRSDDGVVHDALELQWPSSQWEVRTRCLRLGMPASYREVKEPHDCMDCLSHSPWPSDLFDAETYR